MLSRLMRTEFDQRGVVFLRGAFSEDDAAAMRRRVWARLARLGVLEHDQIHLGGGAGDRPEQGH